ncbi:uncharacterized protein LOC9655316 [Selaginella moellendorffii]|uniref:uncharacterized protein LOC9655316 n=1 Tax=Selaginella moellendorffii TaxID=88036 RepID=UPI000D1CAE6F|nr:uncharacterized protein LOC9655316 [Selaginella moellendorffii]|eukprot:XP_024520603.1 uncharacterized protein LOC9655316 [Selaginella moellendorffii]
MGSLPHSACGNGFAEVDNLIAGSASNVKSDWAGLGECNSVGDGVPAPDEMVNDTPPVAELDSQNGSSSDGGSLLGTLVEVRHRATGYRGSWHPAKVVKIDSGRGLVEYEKLLARDGSPHFQEYVPFREGLEVLLRPRPPPLTGKTQEVWQRGLWVDAFYGDAWWEGVLMDNVQLPDEDMQVFFPDEGDRRGFGRQNLRVSQEWDSTTGTWRQKGQWTDLALIEGRKIRVKRTFAVKPKQSGDTSSGILVVNDMGKRKRDESMSDTDDDETIYAWCTRHRKKLPSRILKLPEADDGICPGNGNDADDSMNAGREGKKQKEQQTNGSQKEQQSKLESGRDKLQGGSQVAGSGLISEEAGNHVGGDNQVDNIQAMIMRSGLTPLATKLEMLRLELMGSKGEETVGSKSHSGRKILCEGEEAVGNKSHSARKILCGGEETVGNKSRSAREILSEGEETEGNKNHSARKMLCEPVSIEVTRRRSYRKLVDATELIEEAQAKDDEACTRGTKNSRHWASQDSSISSKGTVLAVARDKARKLLFESGWTVCHRLRERFSRTAKEPFYISPEGKPYMSLATACREWLRRNKHAKPAKDRVKLSHLQLIARGDYGFLPRSGKEASQIVSWHRTRKVREDSVEETAKQKKLTKKGNNENRNGRSRTGCRLEAVLSTPTRPRQEEDAEVSFIKRMTLFSWLIDMAVLNEGEKVQLVNSDTNLIHSGIVTSDGILCNCCKKNFSVSSFQAHADATGGASQMRLPDGRSILDCQLAALKAMELKESELVVDDVEMDENDDTCAVCGDGGQLVCCDHCPSTFHLKCLRLENVPEGDWFCPRCCCASCGRSLYDPTIQTEILYCDQCEREYHSNCVPGSAMKYESSDNQFCSRKCLKIFRGLRKLVGRVNKVDDMYSWTLLRSEHYDQSEENSKLESVADLNTRLALALTVIQECFRPMIDPRSNIDMVSHILYNRRGEDKRMDFRGFYTVVLEKEQELISVASMRVHGSHAAEIPFIGTRSQYRKQGMCRRLINVIQQVLHTLEVQTLVLPAIAEFIETWTSAFGFQKLTAAQGIQLMELNIVTFPGSSVLQKPLTWLECGRKLTPVAEELAYQSLLGEESSAEKTDDEKVLAKPMSRRAHHRSERKLQPEKALETNRQPSLQAEKALEANRQPAKVPGLQPEKALETNRQPAKVPSRFSASKSSSAPKVLHTRRAPASSPESSEDHQVVEITRPVVVAKTRSNRLVKSSSWIAHGLKSLRKPEMKSNKPLESSSSLQDKREQPKRNGRSVQDEEMDWIEQQAAQSSRDAAVKSPTRTFSRRPRPQPHERDNHVHNTLLQIQGSSEDTAQKDLGALWITKWPKSKRSVLPRHYRARFKIEAKATITTRSLRRSELNKQ